MPHFDSFLFKSLLAFITGQCLAQYYPHIAFSSLFVFLGLCFVILPFLLFRKKWIYQSAALYLVLVLGAWVRANYYQLPPDHFSKMTEGTTFTVTIKQILKPNAYAFRYYGEVVAVAENPSCGKILISQQKDPLEKAFRIGTQFITQAVPEKIAPPRNPGSFDYAAYLSNQKIYHQIQLRAKRYFLLPAKPLQGLELLHHFKAKAISRIQSSTLSSSAAAHWLALIFGEKQYLESDLRDAYAQAGVVHLLAISGLHIGIISFAVSWLLLPLLRIRYGKWLQQGLRLTVLWSFALWTGFQPAVVRAVTFFSLLDLSHWGKRPQPRWHRVVLSALILLWIHPPFLNQLGFQLSYIAVFGILLAQSGAEKWYRPKQRWKKGLWNFTIVCVGAQIAVAPLIVYYFNQFPILFLPSNMLLIYPFMASLLIAFVLTPVVIWFSLPPFIVTSYNALVDFLHFLVKFMASIEVDLTANLSLTQAELFTVYALLIASCMGWRFQRRYDWNPLVVAVTLSLLLQGYRNYTAHPKATLWVLHQHQSTTLLYYQQQQAKVYSDQKTEILTPLLLSFQRHYPIRKIQKDSLWRWLDLGDKNLLILNFDTSVPDSFPKADILVLRNNPKVHLDRVLKKWEPSLVIADGSNGSWNLDRWRKSCDRNGIAFKATRDGAVSISL